MYYIPALLTGGGGFFGLCKIKEKKQSQASKQTDILCIQDSLICVLFCILQRGACLPADLQVFHKGGNQFRQETQRLGTILLISPRQPVTKIQDQNSGLFK